MGSLSNNLDTLLLIDSSVIEYELIVKAAKENVAVVMFDAMTETFDGLLTKIAATGATVFEYIGIVQHGSAVLPDYSIVRTVAPALLSDASSDDHDLSSWSSVVNFFKQLKALYSVNVIDLISCDIYSHPQWVDIINKLEVLTDIKIRASSDTTGNLANGGNWIMESDNVNIEGLYFTDLIREYTHILLWRAYNRRSSEMVSPANVSSVRMVSASNSVNGMTSVSSPCSIITWGNTSNGGTSSAVSSLLTDVIAISSTESAFAAIKSNGSVVTWGNSATGENSSLVSDSLTSGVIAIASTHFAFAALKSNGSVVTWGNTTNGGNSSSVGGSLTNGVVAIAATGYAFAAIKSNGAVITWGGLGGNSSAVSDSLTSGVIAIASTWEAFAAIKSNGSVVTWGTAGKGGDSSTVSASLTSDVVAISTTDHAFAALKRNGSVITWGSSTHGANSSTVSSFISSGVVAVASTSSAFAALKSDGSVITWGSAAGGDSSLVSGSLTSGVRYIVSNVGAFAAIKTNDSVVSWGDAFYITNYATVSSSLTGISSISSTEGAFAAITNSGNVIVWGDTARGGSTSGVSGISNITSIISSIDAFAAIKGNGSVVTWGGSTSGGNSSVVSSSLSSGIVSIASTNTAFAAFKTSANISPSTPSPPVAAINNATATVIWTAPVNGGSSITGYTITYTPGNVATSITVSGSNRTESTIIEGLATGVSYTFRVAATNAIGTGSVTFESNAVVPIPILANVFGISGMNITGHTNTNVSNAASNNSGFVYVVGEISSSGFTIPGTTITKSGTSTDAVVVAFNPNRTVAWGSIIPCVNSSVRTNAIVANSSGNVYIVGQTNASGWSVSGTSIAAQKPNSNNEGFIIALNPSGIPFWGSVISGHAQLTGVTTTDNGTVFAVGNGTTIAYNNSGTLLWRTTISGGLTAGQSITSNNSGFAYVTGYTETSGFSVSGTGINIEQFNNTTARTTYIICYNTSGNAVWGSMVNLSGTMGSLTYNTVSANDTGYVSLAYDRYLLLFNNSGDRIWTRTISGNMIARDLAMNTSGFIGVFGWTGLSSVRTSRALVYDIGGSVVGNITLSGASADVNNTGLVLTNSGNLSLVAYTSASGYSASGTRIMGNSGGVFISNYVFNSLGVLNSIPYAPYVTNTASFNGAVRIFWIPGSPGTSPITSYNVTTTPGNITTVVDGSSTFATVGGLINGTQYTFSVTATNSNGNSPSVTTTGTPSLLKPTFAMLQAGAAGESPTSICSDSEGRIYTTGITSSSGFRIIGAAGNTIASRTGTSWDGYAIIYNASGSAIGGQTFTGTGLEFATSMVPSKLGYNSGGVYVAGITTTDGFSAGFTTKSGTLAAYYFGRYTVNTVFGSLNPQFGVILDSVMTATPNNDVYPKLSTAQLSPTREIVYITGVTNVSGFRVNQNPISITKTNSNDDSFILGYEGSLSSFTNGIWGRLIPDCYITGNATNASGLLYVTGYTSTSGFRISGTAISGQKNNTSTNPFVVVYNTSGIPVWGNIRVYNSGSIIPRSIAVNSSGFVYIAGSTTVGLSGAKTNITADPFVIAYNNSGNVIWSNVIPDTSAITGNSGTDMNIGVAVNNSGIVYVTGTTNRSGFTVASTNISGKTNGVSTCSYIVVYNGVTGAVLGGEFIGGTYAAGISGSDINVSDITVNTTGTVYVACSTNISGITISGTPYVAEPTTSADHIIIGYEIPIAFLAPDAPTSVTATAGASQVSVTWVPPVNTGGGAITSYTVTSSPGGFTATTTNGSTTTATVTGLTPKTAYTFTVVATSIGGTGTASSASNSVTPYTTPGAPTAVTATAGSSQASVSWTAPASNGGSAITSYTVTSSPGGFTATTPNGSTTTAIVTGLTVGTAYTFTVRANNVAGAGTSSSASSAITPYTTPDAPTAVTATAGSSQATVSWMPPASDGFSAITSYILTSSPSSGINIVSGTSTTVTGLTPGTAYTFTVRATNAAGLGALSSSSNSVTPYTTPDAPTAVVAIAGMGQASISWVAPVSDGYSAITQYTVTASPGGQTTTSATTSVTMTGLTVGTAYTFTVTATNLAGTSTASTASAAVTPVSAPGTPTDIAVTQIGADEITISWTPPTNTGGSPITSYIVSSSTGDYTTTVAGDQTTATLSGITTGTSYTFSVVATNAVSIGSRTAPSSTLFLITSPIGPVAMALDASVRVTWTLTSGDRSANTGYTITSNPGGFTTTVSGANTAEAVITGLTNGVSYIFTVVANTTSYGSSPTSMPTNAVIPNTVNIISAINESSTSQTSVADYIATQGSRLAPDVLLEAKGGMITEQDGLTLEQRTSVSVQYIESLRSTFGTDTIIVPSAKTLGTTFTARSDVMVDAPVVVFLPAYVAETAVVDLTNFDRNNKYVQIELPPTYSVVLTEGAFSKTLTYDGTTIALDGTPVGVDGKFRIGTTYEYTLAGIGSFLLLATPIVRRVIGNGIRIIAHNFRMF